MLNTGHENFVARALNKAKSYIYRRHNSGQRLKHQSSSNSNSSFGFHSSSSSRSRFTNYIKYISNWHRAARISAFLLTLTIMAILFPISFKSADNLAEAASGTPKQSTLTYNATSSTASVSLSLNGTSVSSGTFATSNNNEKAVFSLSTDNYTGYILRLKTTGATTLTNGTNTINAIESDGITSSSFGVNRWGLLPSKYNCTTNNCAENTTTYYQPTTTGFIMEQTSSANSTPKQYTVGMGLKADYNTPAGTYTSSAIVAEYVARPISYSIAYDKGNITGTPTNIPSTQSDLISSTSVDLSSTAPSIANYTFTGWCMGTVSTNTTTHVDSCTGTNAKTFQAGASFGIDQTTSNDVTLHAMWSIKTFTLTVQNGGNTTVTGSGTYQYGQTVTITATPTTSTTCITYSTPTWTKTSGAGTLNQTSGNSVTFTMGEGTATVAATSTATSVQQTITLSKGTGVNGITIAGTKYTSTSVSLTCGSYAITAPTANFNSGYEFDSWAVSGSLTLGSSTTTASNTITVSGSGTLTLTGKSRIYIQDLTLANCPTDGMTVYDKRDENSYTVKKINNACWMTQNLRYLGDTNSAAKTMTIGNNNSNVANKSITLYSLNSSNAGNFNAYSGHCDSTNSYNYACVYDSGDTTTGVWYNYYAATAGTISTNSNQNEATSDICPKNWHLPTGPNSTVNTNINELVGNTIYDYQNPTAGLIAFSAVAGGNYGNGSLSNTERGYWWSATAHDDVYRYRLYYDSNNGQFHGAVTAPRYYGYFVRCVMKKPTMQDTAIADVNEGEEKSVIDARDGKEYKIKKINGQLWMTQNLRYLGDTGSAAKTMKISNNNSNVANKSITLYSLNSSDAGNFNAYDSSRCDATNGYNNACVYDSGSTSTGVWYNYYAATAGTISTYSNNTAATSDICPKNWHLPTGPNTTANTDFNKLVGNTTSGWQNPTAGLTAFGAVAGGQYIGGSLDLTGNGYWWSATAVGGSPALRYLLEYGSNGQFESFYYLRYLGLFVRCVRST